MTTPITRQQIARHGRATFHATRPRSSQSISTIAAIALSIASSVSPPTSGSLVPAYLFFFLILFPDLFSLPRLPLFPRPSRKQGALQTRGCGPRRRVWAHLRDRGWWKRFRKKGSDCWVEPGFFQDTPLTTQGSSQEEEKRERESVVTTIELCVTILKPLALLFSSSSCRTTLHCSWEAIVILRKPWLLSVNLGQSD